jgi:hypothetical protein
METNKRNSENDNKSFAFLPEMVLEHLNNTKPFEFKEITTDFIKEDVSNPTTPKAIVFDPLADPFDGINIEIEPTFKKKAK